MNRERGVSSLGLVLLLLILGSLLLQGLNQQERSYSARVALESQALKRQAIVQSALEWGKSQHWPLQHDAQCQRYQQLAVVCLCLLANDEAVLIAQYSGVSLWQMAARENNSVTFSATGWSDFCPLKEEALCNIP